MWLLTNFGMFSAVERRAGSIPAGDNRTIQIRARRKEHLEILRERYMHTELGPSITGDDDPRFKNSDYEFRAFCTSDAFGRAAYAVALDIDYTNFKSSVKDDELHDAYMSVWTAIFNGLSVKSFKKYGNYFKDAAKGNWWNDAVSKGPKPRYESVFGLVEDDDDSAPLYRWTSPSAIADKPYDGIDNFTESDYPSGSIADEHNIEALIEQYAPFLSPENTPNVLTRAEAIAWLGSTTSMFRKFLAGNHKWRAYKNGSQNRYEFPKDVMGAMSEDYDIWMCEKMEDAQI